MPRRPKIFFGTTSQIKFDQYQYLFSCADIELIRAPTFGGLIEPQADASSVENMVLVPLKSISRFLAESEYLPYFVDDTMLFVDAFSNNMESLDGLPGADTKNWWGHIGSEKLLRLIDRQTSRKALIACVTGMYFGKERYEWEACKCLGNISEGVRTSDEAKLHFPKTNPYFFHNIFVPLGSDKTLAEMNEAEFMNYDYRKKVVAAWLQRYRQNPFLFERDYPQLELNL